MKQFLSNVFLFSIPLFVLFGGYEYLMYELKESVMVKTVFKSQESDKSLFLRKYLSQSFKTYKTYGIKQSNAETLIIGSSRVMQIKGSYFKGKFYNAGGLIQNNNDLIEFLDSEVTSDLIFIGIDSWWYKENYMKYSNSDNLSEIHTLLKLRYNPVSRIDEIWTDYLEPRNTKHIGVNAQISNGGFRFDGSMKISDKRIRILLKEGKFVDTEDPPINERIKKSSTLKFENSPIDTTAFIESVALIRKAIDNGKRIIVYLPPFTDESFDLFGKIKSQSDFFRFTTIYMPRILERFGIPYIKTESPRDYDINDAYFMDGFHPSEVFLAIQLKKYNRFFGEKIDTIIIDSIIRNRFCEILLDGREFKVDSNP